jgi:ribosomal protein S18 acetylase RimI-like enzyme
MNIYYLAEVRTVIDRGAALPGGMTVRPIAETDLPVLADTFRRAYGPAIAGNPQDPAAEMASALDGTWGEFWPEASPAAWSGAELAGVVLSVRRPSWENVPAYPWLIDVFTDPRHRRAGIARALIARAAGVLDAVGEPRVGLTVDDGNVAALALYRSLGFSAAR